MDTNRPKNGLEALPTIEPWPCLEYTQRQANPLQDAAVQQQQEASPHRLTPRQGNRRRALSKRQRRTIVDILLTVMLIFEMFYQFTGNLLHELVGFALFLGVVLHLLLSKRWISNTVGALGKGTLNRTRKRLSVIAVLLTTDVLVLAFSSIVISRTLWGLGLNLSWMDVGGIWTILHTATAYGVCVLAVVHLSMHWITMAKSLRIEYNPSRRQAIGYGVNFAAGLGVLALGITGTTETAQAMAAIAAAEEAKSAQKTEAQGELRAGNPEQTTSKPEATDRTMTDDMRAELEAKQEKARKKKTEQERANQQATSGGDSSGDAADANSQNTGEDQNAEYYEEPQTENEIAAEAPDQTWGEVYVEEDPTASQEQASGNATGICTLCRKNCSLSAPQCNLPYQAGLL